MISTEKLNKIIELDENERLITVESGVNTQYLTEFLANKRWRLAQNIGSAMWSTIGGNVAIRSGSPFSLKYGTTADWVRNLEVVLPTGEIMWTGKQVSKSATGLELTHLFCGSEGKLGMITKVCLEVLPLSKPSFLFFIQTAQETKLISFINKLFLTKLEPLAIEFVDVKGMNLLQTYFIENKITFSEISSKINFQQAAIWLSFEKEEELGELYLQLCQQLYEIEIYDTLQMIELEHQEMFWKIRFAVGKAVIEKSIFREIDACISRKNIQEWLDFLSKTAKKYNYQYTAFVS